VARHSYPPLDELSPRLKQELAKRVAPDRGNVWKMLMWSPGMAEAFIDFNDAVRYKISLSNIMRQMIILRAGHLCDAPYELHHHTRIAREVGMSDAQLEAVKEGPNAAALDATQKLALLVTDDIVKDRRVSDANLPVAIKVFGENGLQEILMLAGCYIIACVFLRTWGVDIEQPAKTSP
jgi:alkylhydroperoxidase family enzyme